MKTKFISDKIEKALNAQMTQEAKAAQLYLALGSWADVQGFEGIAHFLYHHMKEEREHMIKLVQYINQRGGYCKVQAIPAATAKPKSLHKLFELVLEHERKNTAHIHALVQLAKKEKDYATIDFLAFYVSEQTEEETLALRIIDKLNIIGDSRDGLYEFDKDMAKLAVKQ